MVLVKLISNDIAFVRYSYQPETDGSSTYSDGSPDEYYHARPGILRYNKVANTEEIEILAEMDGQSNFHRRHVFNMIRDNIDNLPQSQVLTWYGYDSYIQIYQKIQAFA